MSYRYGLNGNDLNWESMPDNFECVTCKESLKELRGQARREFLENDFRCEGHVHRYTGKNWAILQDTNSNFVGTMGNVPAYVFNTDYLLDTLMDGYNDPNTTRMKNICNELKERYNSHSWNAPKAIGSAHLSNTGGLVVWAMDENRMVVASVSDKVHHVMVCDIQSRLENGEEFDPDEHESDNYIKFGKLVMDVGMFMRV